MIDADEPRARMTSASVPVDNPALAGEREWALNPAAGFPQEMTELPGRARVVWSLRVEST